ncbi:hypothetical protein OROGR_006541 [Orobanche gracilis]
MLKRQDSLLSSSRRQNSASAATPPPSEVHYPKAVGCMSGIFQLFSKYQNPNKRLTFGRKHEKLKQPSQTAAQEDKTGQQTIDDTNRLLTGGIKVPRSPMLPPEIRRLNDDDDATSTEIWRTPTSPSLVARLMGLEDHGATMKNQHAAEEDRITEKRMLLLRALEKCNDDLEALKRIIKAVQITGDGDLRIQPPLPEVGAKTVHHEGGNTVAAGTNIPVGMVVEKLSRSLPKSISVVQSSTAAAATRVPQRSKSTITRKPGRNDEQIITKLLNDSRLAEFALRTSRQATPSVSTRPCCSLAMVKSVEEVCCDVAQGETMEIGKIGLVLQDHLFREMIEELVGELMKSCSPHSLPFEACKRKLCF